MSAPTLSIARLDARYRVRAAGDERGQLDRVLTLVARDALEPALARLCADAPGEHVCIRRVEAPVRLALARHGDSALATTWADAIAVAISERLRRGGPDVVRYGSSRHALLDMTLCVAAGRLEREWAWRSLGLWPPAESEPARALLHALLGDGAAVAPVLAQVARAGLLLGLVAVLAPAAWLELATAALCSAGASHAVAGRALAGGGWRTTPPAAVHGALRRSDVAAALWSTGAPAVAVAALALVDAEPAAVGALGERLAGALPQRLPARAAPAALAPAPETATARPALERAAAAPAPEPEADGPEPDAAATEVAAADPDVTSSPPARASADDRAPHRDGESLELAPRARARSEFGGIVFVLHAVVALDAAARLAAELPDVELAAALHALALALAVNAEPGDPAALAFAGIAPDAEAPPPVADEAVAAVDALARDVRDWLAARLDSDPGELDLDTLLRREAEIIADPGWIEFHLRIDEIDTAVRRAGLDLDPDHLPFLGCVVRIVYA